MSTIPAFSPGPCRTRAPFVGRFFRNAREDLYEQCSLHIAEKIPSSTRFGSRPRISRMRSYSPVVRLCSAMTSKSIGIAARTQWYSIESPGLPDLHDCEREAWEDRCRGGGRVWDS